MMKNIKKMLIFCKLSLLIFHIQNVTTSDSHFISFQRFFQQVLGFNFSSSSSSFIVVTSSTTAPHHNTYRSFPNVTVDFFCMSREMKKFLFVFHHRKAEKHENEENCRWKIEENCVSSSSSYNTTPG